MIKYHKIKNAISEKTFPSGGEGFDFAGPTDIAEWQVAGGDYNFKVFSCTPLLKHRFFW